MLANLEAFNFDDIYEEADNDNCKSGKSFSYVLNVGILNIVLFCLKLETNCKYTIMWHLILPIGGHSHYNLKICYIDFNKKKKYL